MINKEILYKTEAYKIIGICMEVHKELGKGFSEIIYGDALEIEFKKAQILCQREVKYNILNSFKLFGFKRKLEVFSAVEGFFELHSRARKEKKIKTELKTAIF